MIILGVALIILALLVPALHVLFWIGVVVAVVGLVLLLAGSMGHGVGGRSHYW
jgi:membrane-bound ClpP family serine protease